MKSAALCQVTNTPARNGRPAKVSAVSIMPTPGQRFTVRNQPMADGVYLLVGNLEWGQFTAPDGKVITYATLSDVTGLPATLADGEKYLAAFGKVKG